MTREHTIDATNKKIGRVATEAAVCLMGKDQPDFQKHELADVKVSIINASKVALTEKKKEQKTYTRYTGYPGGLRQPNMTKVLAKHGYAHLFEHAISGMLPKNKLRDRMMKNLIISE